MKPSTVISSVNTQSFTTRNVQFYILMQVFVFVFLVRSRFLNIRFMAHCQFEHHEFGFV